MPTFKEIVIGIALLVLALVVVWVTLILPAQYYAGTVKSQFLKEQKGMDVPWYQAAELDIVIGDQDINIKQKEQK
jgi:hypothetical protein